VHELSSVQKTFVGLLVEFQGTVRVPWLSIIKSVPVYALCVAHFTCNLGYYTLLTCLPQYFKHILHFDIKSVSRSVVFRAVRLFICVQFLTVLLVSETGTASSC